MLSDIPNTEDEEMMLEKIANALLATAGTDCLLSEKSFILEHLCFIFRQRRSYFIL